MRISKYLKQFGTQSGRVIHSLTREFLTLQPFFCERSEALGIQSLLQFAMQLAHSIKNKMHHRFWTLLLTTCTEGGCHGDLNHVHEVEHLMCMLYYKKQKQPEKETRTASMFQSLWEQKWACASVLTLASAPSVGLLGIASLALLASFWQHLLERVRLAAKERGQKKSHLKRKGASTSVKWPTGDKISSLVATHVFCEK